MKSYIGRLFPIFLLPLMIFAIAAHGDSTPGVDENGFCDQEYLERVFEISSASQTILPFLNEDSSLSDYGRTHLDELRASAQNMQKACNAFLKSFGPETSCQIRAEGRAIGVTNPRVLARTCEKIVPLANGATSEIRLRSELVLMNETMIVDPTTPLPTDHNVELLTPNATIVGVDAQ